MRTSPPPLTVHFIMTGGTIDSYYDASRDTAVPNKESIIPPFISSLKLYSNSKFTEVCMKDSRELTHKDLEAILKTVQDSPHERIIVTHGTYTMGDTARFIKANLKRDDQVVILVASMIPIQGFSPSDGPFQLGYAVAQIEYLKPGVYVAVNGRVFTPEEVMKVIGEGRFYSIFSTEKKN